MGVCACVCARGVCVRVCARACVRARVFVVVRGLPARPTNSTRPLNSQHGFDGRSTKALSEEGGCKLSCVYSHIPHTQQHTRVQCTRARPAPPAARTHPTNHLRTTLRTTCSTARHNRAHVAHTHAHAVSKPACVPPCTHAPRAHHACGRARARGRPAPPSHAPASRQTHTHTHVHARTRVARTSPPFFLLFFSSSLPSPASSFFFSLFFFFCNMLFTSMKYEPTSVVRLGRQFGPAD